MLSELPSGFQSIFFGEWALSDCTFAGFSHTKQLPRMVQQSEHPYRKKMLTCKRASNYCTVLPINLHPVFQIAGRGVSSRLTPAFSALVANITIT